MKELTAKEEDLMLEAGREAKQSITLTQQKLNTGKCYLCNQLREIKTAYIQEHNKDGSVKVKICEECSEFLKGYNDG
jgi:formate dehydrogenase maturation protein FdhE